MNENTIELTEPERKFSERTEKLLDFKTLEELYAWEEEYIWPLVAKKAGTLSPEQSEVFWEAIGSLIAFGLDNIAYNQLKSLPPDEQERVLVESEHGVSFEIALENALVRSGLS
jgi:hypothetical protein